MFKNTAFSIECEALLSSEMVLGVCVEYLRRGKNVAVVAGDKLSCGADIAGSMMKQSLRDYRGNWMEDEVYLRTEQLYDKTSGVPDYDFALGNVFDIFYKLDDYNLVVQDSLEEEASAIARTVDPFCIGAWKLARLLDRSHDFKQLRICIENIRPNLYDGKKISEELAENHMHFNGAHPVPANLTAIIMGNVCRKIELYKIPQDVSKGLYTLDKLIKLLKVLSSVITEYAWNSNMLQGDSKEFSKSVSTELNKLVNKGWHFSSLNGRMYLSNFEQYNFGLINKVVSEDKTCVRRILALSVSLMQNNQYTASWLAYLTFIFRLYKVTKSRYLKTTICAFLHCANCVRRYMVMSKGRGLEDFVRFFDVPPRNELSEVSADCQTVTTRHLLRGGATNIDYKVAKFGNDDPYIIKDDVNSLCARVFRGFFEHSIHKDNPHSGLNDLPEITGRTIEKYFNSKHEFHFSQHFIKSKDKTKKGGITTLFLLDMN